MNKRKLSKMDKLAGKVNLHWEGERTLPTLDKGVKVLIREYTYPNTYDGDFNPLKYLMEVEGTDTGGWDLGTLTIVFTEEDATRLRLKIENPEALLIDEKLSRKLRDKTKSVYRINTSIPYLRDLVLVNYYDNWYTVHWLETANLNSKVVKLPKTYKQHFTLEVLGSTLTALKI